MTDKKSVYADNSLNAANENDAWTKLFALVPEGTKVLDIGCSSGNFGAELIKQKGCSVVGIDMNTADVKLASKRLTKAMVKNIEQEDLSDLGSFDVVVMADVIEHLINPVAVLQKVRKLLKKDGIFVFSVPNMANMETRLELLAGRFEYTEFGILDETHLHYYDRIELEKVLKGAGFSVQKYDATIRDVPEKVVTAQLKQLGLTASKKFYDIVNHPDSRAFQFIGVAKAQQGAFAKIKSKTPYDFMSLFIDDLVKRYQSDVERLQKAFNGEQRRVKIMAKENQALREELNKIYDSKGWKMLERVYTTKHNLTSRVNRKAR